MATQTLIIGGLIFFIMGLVHGLASIVDVFRPTQFRPVDDAVRLAMRSTKVRFLRARATMRDAWLGFNISHGLGMLVFGSAAAWLGLNLESVPRAALAVPVVIGLVYFFLSVRFWFYAPTIAAATATACFTVAWWSR